MTTNFPPQDYLPTESKLEGIQVYTPAPPDGGTRQPVVDFKCPQCGATTAYSAADGGLTCTHCAYFEPPEKSVVGKGAQEFEFTVETMQRAASGWGEARKEMACQSCGAVTTLPADTLTFTCAFCGSNKVIQREAPQDVLRPRFLVPFKIDAAECNRRTQSWLESSWMTPAGLKRLAALAAFTPVYLPYWTFDSVTQADWKAEVGHIETESYRENNQTKTRTVTRWRWESGNVQLNIDDLILPGTQRLSRLLLGRLQDFRLAELVPYEPKFLAGFQARAYDHPLEAAWEIAREQMREQTREACRAQASTTLIRNFSMNLDFSQETWRYILLPVYVAAYRFQSQPYQVMVNGQTGMVAGQMPVDWTKVWLVIAALLAPGVLLGLLGLLTLLLGGVGAVIGGFGLFLLVIGMIISLVILRKAMSLDDI